MPRSRIMSFGETDTLSGPILDYLKIVHGIDPDDVMGFSLNCKSNRLQTITVELATRPTEQEEPASVMSALTDPPKLLSAVSPRWEPTREEAAEIGRRIRAVGESTRLVPIIGQTRIETPRQVKEADICSRLPSCRDREHSASCQVSLLRAGQTRTELPVRQPGKALEDQTASCAYVVGFEDAPDGSMGRHPVTCGETIAYHEDNEGAGWWYHIGPQPVPNHRATSGDER